MNANQRMLRMVQNLTNVRIKNDWEGRELKRISFSNVKIQNNMNNVDMEMCVFKDCSIGGFYHNNTIYPKNIINCIFKLLFFFDTTFQFFKINNCYFTEEILFNNNKLISGEIVDTAFEDTMFVDCKFFIVNLTKSKFTNTKFKKSSFEGQDDENVAIAECIFNDTVLNNVVLNHVLMQRCNFNNVRVDSIDCTDVGIVFGDYTGTEFFESEFQHCVFANAKFKKVLFYECIFGTVIFNKVDCEEIRFVNCVLADVTFKKCNFKNATFNQCKYNNVDFTISNLEGVNPHPFLANENQINLSEVRNFKRPIQQPISPKDIDESSVNLNSTCFDPITLEEQTMMEAYISPDFVIFVDNQNRPFCQSWEGIEYYVNDAGQWRVDCDDETTIYFQMTVTAGGSQGLVRLDNMQDLLEKRYKMIHLTFDRNIKRVASYNVQFRGASVVSAMHCGHDMNLYKMEVCDGPKCMKEN